MNGSNYWAGDFLQACIDNWYWIILGWFLLNFIVAPLLGRFCSLNTLSEEEQDQKWMRNNYWTPEVQGDGIPIINLDDEDWKDQIDAMYQDHRGEG